MIHEDNRDQRVIKFIKENWFVIVFVFSMVVAWTNLGNAVTQSSERITALEIKSIAIDKSQNQILVELAGIKSDLLWIRDKIR